MKNLSVSTTKYEQYLGWFYLVFQMLILPDLIILSMRLLNLAMSAAVMNVIYFAINFLATIIIFRRFLWSSIKQSREEPLRLLKAIGFGFLLNWYLGFIVSYVTAILSPQYQNINDANINVMAQEYYLLMNIGTIVLAPMAEELLFRGLIFQGLFRRSKLLAYGVSAAVFSLIHLVSYIGLISPLHFLVGFLQYLPAGIALGYAYEKADSICAPILLHMLVNALGMFAMR